ncbi:MAG: DeoR/GlpR transcriptional regulator [Clostridia bacterium]|nr:DeoR/GlpR transcriptional regulator [Clostridia bacterium]
MLTNARQKMIESIALRDGEVIISKVAKELGVSIETIRRDINVMCEQNLLVKVHGGAVPAQIPISEASYRQRKKSNSAVKSRIGKAAATLIKSNAVVAISTGSTMEAVAAQIKGVHNVCALTNSLPVGQILTDLQERGDFDGKTILFGGELHPTEHLTFGSAVCDQIQKYYADIAFIGAAAVCEQGLMSTGTEEGNVAAELIGCAAKVVLVIESKKLGKRSVYRFASPEQIHAIITDDETPISEEMMHCFEEHNIDVTVISK